MGQFMKPGKVVIVLARHYSGCKAVVENIDGTSDFPCGQALVPRIDHSACKVTAAMGKKKKKKKENQESKHEVFCESL
jgi:ribosomal protein L14E/L6E/L27E